MSCGIASHPAINKTDSLGGSHVLNFDKDGIAISVDLTKIKDLSFLMKLSDENLINVSANDLENIRKINPEWAKSIFDKIINNPNNSNLDLLEYSLKYNKSRSVMYQYIQLKQSHKLSELESRELFNKIVDRVLSENALPLKDLDYLLNNLSAEDSRLFWERYSNACREKCLYLSSKDISKYLTENLDEFDNPSDVYAIIKDCEKCSESKHLIYDVLIELKDNASFTKFRRFCSKVDLVEIASVFGNPLVSLPYEQKSPLSNLLAKELPLLSVRMETILKLNNPSDSKGIPLSHQMVLQFQPFSTGDIAYLGNPKDAFGQTIYHYMAGHQSDHIEKKQLMESIDMKDKKGNIPMHFVSNLRKFEWTLDDFKTIVSHGNPKNSQGKTVIERLMEDGVPVPKEYR